MTAAFNIEQFIRDAYGFRDKKIYGRGECPDKYADADHINEKYLSKVKNSVTTAMQFFITDIEKNEVDSAILLSIKAYLGNTQKAKDIAAIDKILEDFRNKVLSNYYSCKDGKWMINK
jgi:hypothetical protein